MESRTWHLATVSVPPLMVETASSVLFDLGCGGIVTLCESEDAVKLGAYFAPETNAGLLAFLISSAMAEWEIRVPLAAIDVVPVPDEDWMKKWKEGFEPVPVGDRLLISPSWKLPDTADLDSPAAEFSGRVVVQIDPGMAFGTGTHETTRLCLQIIESRWKGGRMLDVGTGTGILSIAAALLTPDSEICAIDVDPQAVEIAVVNVEINRVTDRVKVSATPLSEMATGHFDLVVANLTAEVLIELMAGLATSARPGGQIVMSGILREFADDVEQAAGEAGLSVDQRITDGEWAALSATKPAVERIASDPFSSPK